MAKEVMIFTDEDIRNLNVSESTLNTYKWALTHAGIEMTDEGAVADFIQARNLKNNWADLAELEKYFRKFADSIKEVLKHTFNVGTSEDLPSNVKWSKQSYTQKFVDGGAAAIVANMLVSKRLVTKDQLLETLTVSNVSKASGITVEKLMDMFPDTIVQTEKERTLSVK